MEVCSQLLFRTAEFFLELSRLDGGEVLTPDKYLRPCKLHLHLHMEGIPPRL